ncbi:LacI family transcriptional regulator [Devosia insulae DS-56]|uniref:LacI family transcriptional regulator n=1 Tax=Devosia insulae DS-56 TaxID=1116389 RepID=A0A1E5XQF8_9HYPH|nr:LacI family DNA-binding transcriptional regulator [Devosia insulae]OEO30841.1 LacI family transcriptional regulator [Devosia insulae DS-56]
MAKAGRLTQRDIARIAGVSQATVSLVLNDAKAAEGRIPDETRERVQKAIRETGYVADPIARRMAKGLNRILGVFTYEPAFPSAQADFFAPFLFGIEETAQTLGYDLLLLTGAPANRGKRKIFDENNRLRLADGCVILGREFDRAELKRLVAGDYPFVAVGRRDPIGGPTDTPVPYVGADYVAATAEMVRRAKAKGHTKLAYVGPSKGAESSVDRWAGFASAITDAEPAPGEAELVLHIPEVGGKALPMLEAIRASGASVVFFTEMADAVIVDAAARSQNLAVPGDLSIVVLGSHLRPMQSGTRFTTFSVPREEMARRATQMLCERIEAGSAGEQVVLPCEPVEGDTLGVIHPSDKATS